MRTVVLEPATAGLDEVLERRRRSGLDRLDEVWEGVLHMVPAPRGGHSYVAQQLAEILGGPARDAGLVPGMGDFNLGESEHDYRVPDGGIHRNIPEETWHATAAIVIEIASPNDESWEKLPFYARQLVDEVLIVDPQKRAVHWLALVDGEYVPIDHSRLIDVGVADLTARISWPRAA
jgi:Uma2 family endonuclease